MVQRLLQAATSKRLFAGSHRWALFFDLQQLQTRYQRIDDAFPADALHAAAIKANPLVSVLERLVDVGAGLEAASFGEIELAKRAGAQAERIVFDSPVKTEQEIQRAIEAGIYLNADNLLEIDRIAACNPPADARIGIRINPVVGSGDIEATSVAKEDSPFGVSLTRNRRALVDAFRRHQWLRGLHVHTGSQGLDLALLVEGIGRCVDFADDIDRTVETGRIDTIDIGGGLPVAYRPHRTAPTVEDYADALYDEVPHLFERCRGRQIITEFGRWLHAPCAVAASRVEYVKPSPGGAIATIHFGADFLLRTAYRPDDWYHRLTVHGPDGALKTGDEVDLTVAGPLCFSGDIIARKRRLPRPAPGDIIAVHDVGGYTFSMWSRYCSRSFPAVFEVCDDGTKIGFQTLHSGETPADVADFWEK